MPRPGFYNDNEYRWYPFIYQKAPPPVSVPLSTIVDCGIIMGLDSQFDESQHTVWLASVSRTGDTIEFTLTTNAPGVTGPLVFTRDVDATEWQTEHVESSPGGEVCSLEPAWEGFLVTGPLQELVENLEDGVTREFSSSYYVVEPGRIQSLVKSYLRSITVGNMARPEARSSCDETNTVVRPVIINSRCINGNIRFKEGYNALIRQRDSINEISIGAARGSGQRPDGSLCENGSEIPFYAGEQPPPGSQFFSGGPACDELISSINGVQGPDITIVGGTGVEVRIDPDNPNTLRISLSNTNIAGNC